jgi:tripartite-type tricarboxylate transporter receptor subunit TctC
MKLPRRKLLDAFAAAFAIFFVGTFCHDAWSQATRTIRIVVPFPPGGSADILARLLAEQIGHTQALTIAVENRPGAATAIGTEAVSRAVPDGNTILLTNNTFIINPQVRKLNYHPLTGFEPICRLISVPILIVVNSASSYRTLVDLLDAARAKPAELTLASVTASTSHLTFEMLKRAANVNMTFVSYPGSAPAVSALLGQHVTAVSGPYFDVAEQLKAGTLRALAAISSKRMESLPEVPTVAELGYKDYEADLWNGLFAPGKTPKEAVSQFVGWFTAAMAAPEINAKLVVQGQIPDVLCGADFGAYRRKQHDEYARVIREANIKAE